MESMIIKGPGYGMEYLRGISKTGKTEPTEASSRRKTGSLPAAGCGKTDTVELSSRIEKDSPLLREIRDDILKDGRQSCGAKRVEELKNRIKEGEIPANPDELADILLK